MKNEDLKSKTNIIYWLVMICWLLITLGNYQIKRNNKVIIKHLELQNKMEINVQQKLFKPDSVTYVVKLKN